MEEQRDSSLAKNLKKKKIRKYVLIALALALVGYGISLITIEAPDAKLPDGQGNVVVNQDANDAVEQKESAGNATDIKRSDAESSGVTEEEEKADFAGGQGLLDTEEPDESDEPEDSGTTDKPTAQEAAIDNSDDFTASNKGNVALKPKDAQPVTVTLEIRCDTLSQNMDYLETPSIAGYIPEDGVILARTKYKGTTDNTVFDVLNTLCRNNDIHLEFSFTPLYESNYIEGIGYLYEFDGGPASGWMYKVNEWFPNYGCSSYYLSDGDEIVWCYTCRGYGADVGDGTFSGTMNGLTEVKEE